MEKTHMIYFDALTQSDCETIRHWRNEDISGARTPYMLTELHQTDFYRDVVNDSDGHHRYWAVRKRYEMPDALEGNGNDATCRTPDSVDLIGIAGLTNIEWENSRAEVALMIGPDSRGFGYGRKALAELYEWGFNRMGLHSIYGNVYTCNPSIDFWSKMRAEFKMSLEYIPNAKWWDGEYHRAMFFELDRDLWDGYHKAEEGK